MAAKIGLAGDRADRRGALRPHLAIGRIANDEIKTGVKARLKRIGGFDNPLSGNLDPKILF